MENEGHFLVEMLGHLRIISVLLFMHLSSFVHSCSVGLGIREGYR